MSLRSFRRLVGFGCIVASAAWLAANSSYPISFIKAKLIAQFNGGTRYAFSPRFIEDNSQPMDGKTRRTSSGFLVVVSPSPRDTCNIKGAVAEPSEYEDFHPLDPLRKYLGR